MKALNTGINRVTEGQVNKIIKCDWILENGSKSHIFISVYYHCNMKSITFPIIFHSTTRNSMLKLLKECKKYSVNTYTQVEISLNT